MAISFCGVSLTEAKDLARSDGAVIPGSAGILPAVARASCPRRARDQTGTDSLLSAVALVPRQTLGTEGLQGDAARDNLRSSTPAPKGEVSKIAQSRTP
jgi:hypothetical protein